MAPHLLIKNAHIVNADTERRAEIYCVGEKIARIAPTIDEAELRRASPDLRVIDAADKLVCPGFIDPHVHIHLPFMGTHAKDNHDSASRAALAGGTTAYIEMICPAPDQEPKRAFAEWASRAADKSICDYSFHLGVVRFDKLAQRQIRDIIENHNIRSLKVFLAYKGALDVSDETLFAVLTLAKEMGVVVTAHCENAEAIAQMQQRLLAQGNAGPQYHEPSRPAIIEAEGVTRLTTFAALTGAEVYIVHTSCEDAVRAAMNARAQGVTAHIECVAPHLVLDKSFAERGNSEGAKFVMSPPLRHARHQAFLWNAIKGGGGVIDTIATDHAPFDTAQKALGHDDFSKIPNGIPSIQERVQLIYTHAVATGLITRTRFVDLCATRAARIFGMHPTKGVIAEGSDADIVIFDPAARATFSRESSHSLVDYCAFEDMPYTGAVATTIRRGEVLYNNGAFIDTPSRGILIPRTPTN